MPTVTVAAWEKLALFLRSNFHQPDLEALRIVIAACRAQQHPGDPVWLFVIGPPGSGKTSIIINCVSALPNAHIESSITPKTLLSCAAQGNTKSLLTHIGSGILAFKDFTTILSKNEESQREIISQFREVYDGSYSSKTGVEWRNWEGKLTVIAAVTYAIERAWSVHRDLGERFMQVRWPKGDSHAIATKAREQRGQEREISQNMRLLIKQWYGDGKQPAPHLPSHLGPQLDHLACAVATLRASVIRDTHGKRDIVDVNPAEEPSRLVKGLEAVICHHAALMEREPGPDDYCAGLRLALDSIPFKRSLIMSRIPQNERILLNDLIELTGIPRATIERQLEELLALNVLEDCGDDPLAGRRYALHPDFAPLWAATSAHISEGNEI